MGVGLAYFDGKKRIKRALTEPNNLFTFFGPLHSLIVHCPVLSLPFHSSQKLPGEERATKAWRHYLQRNAVAGGRGRSRNGLRSNRCWLMLRGGTRTAASTFLWLLPRSLRERMPPVFRQLLPQIAAGDMAGLLLTATRFRRTRHRGGTKTTFAGANRSKAHFLKRLLATCHWPGGAQSLANM